MDVLVKTLPRLKSEIIALVLLNKLYRCRAVISTQ